MYDHFHSECCTNLNREHGKKSNDAEKDKEVPQLTACHVKEKTRNHMWCLDTGYRNHICSDKFVFTDLNEFK